MEGEVASNNGGKRKVWVILIATLLAVAIVLGVVIFLRFHNNGEEFQDDTSEVDTVAAEAVATNRALRVCDEIKNGYFNGELTFNETRQKYKEASGDSDNIYRVKFAMCYAGFVSDVTGNTNWSIEILKEVERLVYGSDMMKVSYYAMLERLYIEVGDSEGANRASKMLDDFKGLAGDGDVVIQEEYE